MKLTKVAAVGTILCLLLSGCAVKMVDGSTMQLTTISDTDNRFYQGVYMGCVQTLIMQSNSLSLMQPELPGQIAKQCMLVATMAVKNESHTLVIPGWPGLESIRQILEELEENQADPNVATF